MTRTRLITCAPLAAAAVSALTAMAAPAGASAAGPRFRVQVEGTQTTTWKSSYEAKVQCDQSAKGSGRETVAFKSKPLVLSAQKAGPAVIMWGTVWSKAKIARQGKVVSTPLPRECEGTNGLPGSTPTRKPDCGTRRTDFIMTITYEGSRVHPGFTIQGSNGQAGYLNCPVQGISFPNIVNYTSRGRLIMGSIPAHDLFDRSLGKHIVLASGKRRDHNTAGGSITSSTTKTDWKITLTRVKK